MVWDTADRDEVVEVEDEVEDEVDAQPDEAPGVASDQVAAHLHAGDQTRARILQVALELMADRGYAATSTREIAERLGFTKAALYYHFRTKDDLLAALVAPVTDELEALIAQACADGSPDACRDLVVGYVDLVGRHAELIRVLSSDPSVKESAGLHSATPLFRQLVPLLAGTASPDKAQRIRVRAALSAVHGTLVHAQPDDDPEMLRTTAIEVACAALGLSLPSPDSELPGHHVQKEYAR
jgi:AcrR family transcriptional regulator